MTIFAGHKMQISNQRERRWSRRIAWRSTTDLTETVQGKGKPSEEQRKQRGRHDTSTTLKKGKGACAT
jgi:hypothetical protein